MRRRLARIAVVSSALLALGGAWLVLGLPSQGSVRELRNRNPGRTALMRQREREAGAKGRKARVLQSWVPLSQVSRHLIHAVLAAEDQNFFGHEGVDWDAIQKSIEHDVQRRRFARGGSTITQQLAKNLFFGTQRTLTRKLRELIVARWLEADLPKARILTLYLNVIEWGDGVYGCEAAARHWYGKPAATLSPAEAAGLAAMIPNPRRLNPQRNAARHARATRRVLWLMTVAGYLGRDAAGLGAEPPPELLPELEEDDEAEPAGEAAPSAVAPTPADEATPESTPPPATPPATPPVSAPPASGPPPSVPEASSPSTDPGRQPD